MHLRKITEDLSVLFRRPTPRPDPRLAVLSWFGKSTLGALDVPKLGL
jgi:hypothetical protein